MNTPQIFDPSTVTVSAFDESATALDLLAFGLYCSMTGCLVVTSPAGTVYGVRYLGPANDEVLILFPNYSTMTGNRMEMLAVFHAMKRVFFGRVDGYSLLTMRRQALREKTSLPFFLDGLAKDKAERHLPVKTKFDDVFDAMLH